MENYIALFNSITGALHTMPVSETEMELVKSTPMYQQSSQQELCRLIYDGLMNYNENLYFTASIAYLLKSETYKLNSSIGNNTYPIYLSRGNGTGFVRLCGGMSVSSIQEAADMAPGMIDLFMTMYGEKKSVGRTNTGSNYTKPKKRRK
jgi:hypothetical protein